MASGIESAFVTNIFSKVKQLLKNSAVDVETYDGEFLDPEKLKELQFRYSTKLGALVDIEDVIFIEQDNSLQAPKCNVTVVLYCISSNKREVSTKVENSIQLAGWSAGKLAGSRLEAGTNHNSGLFQFLEIVKEDQIPFVSVHALRVTIELVIQFNA